MYAITVDNLENDRRENIIEGVTLVSFLVDGSLLVISKNINNLQISDGSVEVFNSSTSSDALNQCTLAHDNDRT